MQSPLLDILIPTFNRVEHLNRLLAQLESAVQGLSSPSAVRIIVSDNASVDSTHSSVVRWQQRMPNWQLVSQQHNIGMMRNFEFLIRQSTATYCWLIGDDDELLPSFSLENLLRKLTQVQPALLIFAPTEDQPLFAGGSTFSNSRAFVEAMSVEDPDFLRRHTWITANVFMRESFDANFARVNRKSWYLHMYGIFRGIRDNDRSVVVQAGSAVRPSAQPGVREANFPNAKLMRWEWAKYFYFLARDYSLPALRHHARKWDPGAVFKLRSAWQSTAEAVRRFARQR